MRLLHDSIQYFAIFVLISIGLERKPELETMSILKITHIKAGLGKLEIPDWATSRSVLPTPTPRPFPSMTNSESRPSTVTLPEGDKTARSQSGAACWCEEVGRLPGTCGPTAHGSSRGDLQGGLGFLQGHLRQANGKKKLKGSLALMVGDRKSVV